MPTLDAATLLLVITVVDVFACVVWLLLGEVLRIAPRAARRIALYHGLLAIVWWPTVPAGLEPLVGLPVTLVCAGLLTAGVRGLMRLRHQLRDVVAVVLVGLAAHIVVYPDLSAARAVSNVFAAVLALMAGYDILRGAGFRRAVTLLLVVPYLVLAGAALWRAGGLLGWLPPGLGLAGLTTNAPLALLRLVVNLSITTGLVALVLQRLIARVRHLTRRDPLTGLLNRRAVEEHLQRLQQQVDRGRSHAVVVLDVDHFKRINDDLGHAGGDAALQHLAQVLGEALRTTDCFGRLGGEEFTLLLPDTDEAGAVLVAERLRRLLQERPLTWVDKIWPMSASFGVAAMRLGEAHGLDALARADAAMYAAKARGRNRVQRATEQGEPA
ncbi:diguanylate cyclase (GGDEF) domain-containing protein [Roseateles sp. YR242]|uniref:GGDEF domain-containing protein n=1 Tax=Roseateles sp. YR242 TaxID=1855305 RepID=UPI0008AEB063|nr:GGDEF domain-containing protein [Roseateles sp. YR242]SEK83082.1 diguanylate cyclase (GGDEF) domain-containing protein [Roseateles sp. YR242]